MKKNILIIVLFILFALPIPVAVLGFFMSFLWLLASLMQEFSFVEFATALFGVIIGFTYSFTYAFALTKTLKERKISIQTFLPIAHCLLGFLFLLSLKPTANYISNTTEHFGFAKKDFTVVEEVDTHGGFHGDGHYYLVLDCSDNKEMAQKNLKNWHKLPLPENLDDVVFGTEIDGVTYRNGWAEEANVPTIKNGYYMFKDRHSESKDSTDASQLFDRYSFNFSIAVYDCDTNKMYYFDFDT